MISFDYMQVVSKIEQVLIDVNYVKVCDGMVKDDVCCLFGVLVLKVVFDNFKEEIWEWCIEGMLLIDEIYFMVYFDMWYGVVKKILQWVVVCG